MLEMLICVVSYLLAMTKSFQKQEEIASNRNHKSINFVVDLLSYQKNPLLYVPASRAGLNYCGALCETDCAEPSLGMDKNNN